jgi:hypothetical protein
MARGPPRPPISQIHSLGAHMKRTPLQRRTPLARGKSTLKRSRLRRQSVRFRVLMARDATWREVVFHYRGRRCVFTKTSTGLNHRGRIDCAHIYGKQSHPHLRHHPMNGLPVCRAHHRWAHANPKQATEYFLSLLTPIDRVLLLTARAQSTKAVAA